MRVRIIFNLKNKGGYVPFHHQFILAQTSKAILISGKDEEFINYPYYHFSGLKGQTRISRQGLHFHSSKVTLVLASPSERYIDYFVNSLFKHEEIQIGNLALNPLCVEKEIEPELSESVKYICISPLVLIKPSLFENTGKQFIYPSSDEFSDLLYDSTISRMEAFGFSPEQLTKFFKFQIVPDEQYLERLKQSNRKFARIYPVYDQDVKYEVRGYTFPFTLYAAKEVQDFLFTCGLGLFSSKGFGMIDIANADPIDRTVPYELAEGSKTHVESMG